MFFGSAGVCSKIVGLIATALIFIYSAVSSDARLLFASVFKFVAILLLRLKKTFFNTSLNFEYEFEKSLCNKYWITEYKTIDSIVCSAMNYLENLDATPETAAHWRTLASLSLDQLRIPIAQRCYAELGDIAKARYLKVSGNLNFETNLLKRITCN